MKREAVEEFVSSVVEGIIAGTDMELVDVDYVRERDWYLRVYLDKPGGVDLVRYNGRDVDIQLFKPVNGSKQFTGALQGFTDTSIDFTINGESITFERSAIAQIRLHLDF